MPTFFPSDPELFDRIFAVNVKGVYLGCKYGMAQMKANGGGSIVNIASIAGKEGNPNASHYSASKAGLINFAQCAAKDLAPFGVRVNALSPAGVYDGHDAAFAFDAVADGPDRVRLRWAIAKGYYLYRHRITIGAAEGFTPGTLELPPGKRKVDEFFAARPATAPPPRGVPATIAASRVAYWASMRRIVSGSNSSALSTATAAWPASVSGWRWASGCWPRG